ncbi:MAG: aspartate carbamoyltransferase catalytic subunit [Chloroflexota bacterium]|nr:aspartate carbamoyltransferase catalytic subunit [Chloroflexota bacterium]
MRWQRRHVLSTEDWSRDEIELVLEQATAMLEVLARPIRRTPALRGRTVVLFFAEASTRTRMSFELAAKSLSADTSIITASGSSVEKGETLYDTVRTLQALGAEIIVLRHSASGAPYFVAERVSASVINAGDGWHAHPTQGLLDALTLRGALGDLDGKRVAIVGDILHSRVARSDVHTLVPLGARVVLCGPPTLVPSAWRGGSVPDGVAYEPDVDRALADADAVIALRLQRERQEAGLLPSLREYRSTWGITEERAARLRPGVPILHPGPMNEGVEIDASVAHGPRSLVERQVTNGVAVRMALLYLLATAGAGTEQAGDAAASPASPAEVPA